MDVIVQWILTSKWYVYITGGVTLCSALHSLLPPWNWDPDFVKEGLKEFPGLQRRFHSFFDNRWYRVFVYAVGFVALNARSTFWRSISVENPKGVNANLQALNGKVKVIDPVLKKELEG